MTVLVEMTQLPAIIPFTTRMWSLIVGNIGKVQVVLLLLVANLHFYK